MCQQTQVATVIPFFERWMSRFPTVEDLAVAEEQEVLAYWSGLGYYRRAKFLHAGARWVTEHGFPSSAKAWLAVPGVGRYTAAAIASISLDESAPLVDGNVERVFARMVGNDMSGDPLHRAAWAWAQAVMPSEAPGDWNQALMELGATVCTPRQPKCLMCPVQDHCQALALGRVNELPVAQPRRSVVELSRNALICRKGSAVALSQIEKGQWWEGLWEFPCTTESPPPDSALFAELKHTVTHHRISLSAYLVDHLPDELSVRWVDAKEIGSIPMPAPQKKLAEMLFEETNRGKMVFE